MWRCGSKIMGFYLGGWGVGVVGLFCFILFNWNC